MDRPPAKRLYGNVSESASIAQTLSVTSTYRPLAVLIASSIASLTKY
jgi:hypothetical protein